MANKSDTMTYIVNQIKFGCRTFKDRSAGSESERECQKHFKSELNKWSDSVTMEEFELHPQAFLGWIAPVAMLEIAAIAFYWLGIAGSSIILPLLGLLCAATGFCVFLFEFGLYYKCVDFLFPKTKSANLYAQRKPKGEVKQRIIFGGHADAAYEMPFLLNKNKRSAYAAIFGTAIGMVYMLVLSAVSFIMRANIDSIVWIVLGAVAILFIPAFVAVMFFVDSNLIVDGANDNMSGSLVAMSILKEMAENDVRLENTEVCCLITGAEEAGLRGALAFAKEHHEELNEVETFFIAIDTLADAQQLRVYTKGINGTQRNDPAVAQLLRTAGENVGTTLEDAGAYPGATDAEAFSRFGVPAAAICAVDHEPQEYYHTRYDTADNISEECIQKARDICMQAAYLYDSSFEPKTVADTAEVPNLKKVSGL